jgi:hypothetical protein
MIKRVKLELTEDQIFKLAPLRELVNEANEKGLEIGEDHRGIIFAQLTPYDETITAFFLPFEAAKAMCDLVDTITIALDKPPPTGEKE